jgi:hypothetical protein
VLRDDLGKAFPWNPTLNSFWYLAVGRFLDPLKSSFTVWWLVMIGVLPPRWFYGGLESHRTDSPFNLD